MKLKKGIILIVVLLATLGIDQYTKQIVETTMHVGESHEIIPGFFAFTHVQNTGAAWGLFSGKQTMFFVVTIVALIVLTVFLWSTWKDKLMSSVAITLMISGTIGNFIDRLQMGYVTDFLDFNLLGYDFPVFNVADMCLVIGISLLLLFELLDVYGVKAND
ncbi:MULTISPECIES: signal peptidase II [unclassified Breznakia]|uniref:signal peptidase II n=1 Tax=unclassified Breznakia TaxID=2623764 RepID=UPI002473C792|nr:MULTISPECIES: signal peptidase II [unclassified Breznakia]MDH6366077.1 signal peptidase II [Breznakia sp. PH1-1]MDH6402991.1 signal peptidase II [Breznakia sp. PF1-11]MDH6410700.1 signal peptidase II [Breznakia sp. PFB1-11]MDH6413243.1 signal peptidase II [Breznakia sp. PFB1-14]MDH6415611.1 signal peptidase II [Breznakia sp. PFB1-4]